MVICANLCRGLDPIFSGHQDIQKQNIKQSTPLNFSHQLYRAVKGRIDDLPVPLPAVLVKEYLHFTQRIDIVIAKRCPYHGTPPCGNGPAQILPSISLQAAFDSDTLLL